MPPSRIGVRPNHGKPLEVGLALSGILAAANAQEEMALFSVTMLDAFPQLKAAWASDDSAMKRLDNLLFESWTKKNRIALLKTWEKYRRELRQLE